MPNIYVSSTGNNSNDGLTPAAPKLTLAAAASATSSGDTIYLKRGDSWEEGFGVSGSNGKHFRAYGTGAKPFIDGTSSVTAWSLTGTATYTASVALNETNATTEWPMVLEDGVLMKRQTSLANCEANPGSYYIASSSMSSSPVSVVIHATGSGNPTSNGKAYRVTTRVFGIAEATTIAGISGRGFGSNNGSLVATAAVSDVKDCEVYAGGKHNFFSGLTQSYSEATDAHFQSVSGASTLFVIFANSGVGKSARFYRCIARQDNGQTLNSGHVGFYSHDSVGARGYDLIEFLGCAALNVGTAFSSSSQRHVVQGCYGKNNFFPFGANRIIEAYNSRFFLNAAYSGTMNNQQTVSQTVQNCLFAMDVSSADPSNPLYNTNAATAPLTFTNCSFIQKSSASNTNGWGVFTRSSPSATLVTANRCLFFGAKSNKCHIATANNMYVGDYNIFSAWLPNGTGQAVNANYNAVSYSTLATWQAATGQDANSVYLSSAQAAAFFLNDPLTGDYRINPSAQVTAGNGTVYTGTFPDGTPITTCGVQDLPIAWPTTQELTDWATVPNDLSLNLLGTSRPGIASLGLAKIGL